MQQLEGNLADPECQGCAGREQQCVTTRQRGLNLNQPGWTTASLCNGSRKQPGAVTLLPWDMELGQQAVHTSRKAETSSTKAVKSEPHQLVMLQQVQVKAVHLDAGEIKPSLCNVNWHSGVMFKANFSCNLFD